MKKRIAAIAAVIALLAIAVAGGTLAYFTDAKSATNTFTLGNVKIDLLENKGTETGLHGAEYDSVTPGIPMSKEPYVKNTGVNPAYVRIDVTVTDWTAFAEAGAAHGITDLSVVFGDHPAAAWTRYAETPDPGNDTMTYSYLYNGTVAAGANTEFLFKTVTVPAEFTTTEMEAIGGADGKFEIQLNAYAIQADGDTEANLIAALKAMP